MIPSNISDNKPSVNKTTATVLKLGVRLIANAKIIMPNNSLQKIKARGILVIIFFEENFLNKKTYSQHSQE